MDYRVRPSHLPHRKRIPQRAAKPKGLLNKQRPPELRGGSEVVWNEEPDEDRDVEHLRAVREGGCILSRRVPAIYEPARAMLGCEPTRCRGPIDPHHPRYKGQGANIKTSDRCAFGLCRGHHDEIHAGTGTFVVLGELPEDFQREASAAARDYLTSHGSRRSG